MAQQLKIVVLTKHVTEVLNKICNKSIILCLISCCQGDDGVTIDYMVDCFEPDNSDKPLLLAGDQR